MKPTSLRLAIIDDEPQSRQTLRILLNDYCPQVEIVGEADGVLTGFKLLQPIAVDAIFLDIQLGDGTGFDLLNKFPNPSFQVIFITAFDDFAIKAFRYNAIDYLLKPIDIDEFLRAVNKITPARQPDHNEQLTNLLETNMTGKFEKIALSSSEGLHFLELKDIVRLESDTNYTTFYMVSGEKVTVAKTLKTFEELLPNDDFFRPHQSHIVNLTYIKKILREDGGYLLMNGNSKIPVSRSKKEHFLSMMKGRFLQ